MVKETSAVLPSQGQSSSAHRVYDGPLFKVHWFRVILDEAHSIRNRKTHMSHAAAKLSATYRWCLSGTPIQNSVNDVFSLFRFLRHPDFGQYAQFDRHLARPIERGRANAFEPLRRALSGLLLRRTKYSRVQGMPILQLPQKIIASVQAVMSPAERTLYKDIEDQTLHRYRSLCRSMQSSYLMYLVLILRLRQASSHPWLLKDYHKAPQIGEQLRAAERLSPGERRRLIRQLQADEDVCGLCQDLPECPVVGFCGHTFCHQCFKLEAEKGQIVTNDWRDCPCCGRALETGKFFTESCLRAADGEDPADQEDGMPEDWQSSAKVEKLMEILNGIRGVQPPQSDQMDCDVTDKVLVYSQWTSMLDLVELPLEQQGFRFLRLDGTMNLAQRTHVLEEFASNPDVAVLLMSLRAASLGLNLTSANHVVLLDLWWNPAVEEQAIDRVHRIGQEKPVYVTRITVQNTVDEKILALQKKKLSLIENAFHSRRDVSVSGRLTMQDIHFLFDFPQSIE